MCNLVVRLEMTKSPTVGQSLGRVSTLRVCSLRYSDGNLHQLPAKPSQSRS